MCAIHVDDRLALIKAYDLSDLCDDAGNSVNVILLVKSWVSLLLECPTGSVKSDSLILRELRLFKVQYSKQVSDYSKLADKLNASITIDDFGTHVASLHWEFKKLPIFAEYNSWFKTGDPYVFQFILTYLLFGKKAVFLDPKLIEDAAKAWADNDERLGKVVYPEHVIEDLAAIFRATGFRIDVKDVIPKHGPGSVSDGDVRTFSQKCEKLRYAPELDSYLELITEGAERDDAQEYLLPDFELWQKGRSDPKHACVMKSEQLFVPQDKSKVRTIFREPTSAQYFQQGVLHAMEKAIEKTIYSKMTTLRDQGKNQRACAEAAYTGKWSTIDLSRASDSVSTELVTRIFDQDLLEHLYATRTSIATLVDGSEVTTNRFSGMGSATCFPLQCLVYGTVLMLANCLTDLGIPISQYMRDGVPVFKGRLIVHEWDCVYGDDIVCHQSQTEALMSLLATLGFIVNDDKSFYGARQLRESCGVYYLAGHPFEVTPLRFKVKGLESGAAECVEGMIDLINRSSKLGYMNLRQFLLDCIPRHRYVTVPEGSQYQGPCYVVTLSREANPLPSRGYQAVSTAQDGSIWRLGENGSTVFYRVLKATTLINKVVSTSVDRYLYNSWLHSPSISDGSKPRIGDTGKTVLRWAWMPA